MLLSELRRGISGWYRCREREGGEHGAHTEWREGSCLAAGCGDRRLGECSRRVGCGLCGPCVPSGGVDATVTATGGEGATSDGVASARIGEAAWWSGVGGTFFSIFVACRLG